MEESLAHIACAAGSASPNLVENMPECLCDDAGRSTLLWVLVGALIIGLWIWYRKKPNQMAIQQPIQDPSQPQQSPPFNPVPPPDAFAHMNTPPHLLACANGDTIDLQDNTSNWADHMMGQMKAENGAGFQNAHSISPQPQQLQ